MRFGCCLNMVSSQKDKGTGADWIEELAKAGYDYAELPLAEMTALSEEEFGALADRVGASGIRCEVCNNFFPKTIRLTGGDVEEGEIMAYAEKALGRAGRLGVENVVFGSGPAKNVPEGFPLERGYGQVVRLLRMVAPVADSHGIVIVIEPLRKAECNLINTFAEGCGLARDAGCGNVKVLVDYYHMSVEGEPAENVAREGAAFLRHVHFANPNGRIYPKDPSESDYGAFFEALGRAGYDGRISCEAFSGDFAADAEAALRFFRSMAP